MLSNEMYGVVKEISENFIIIECDSIDYFSTRSDFFYKDIKLNDNVTFKDVSDVIKKATFISLCK